MQCFHVKDIGCEVDIGIYRVVIGLRGARLKGIQGLCRDAVHDFGFRNGPANHRNSETTILLWVAGLGVGVVSREFRIIWTSKWK